MDLYTKKQTSIENVVKFEGKIIELQGWVMNRRSSKNLEFIVLRDGTGYIQCVVSLQDVDENIFELASGLTLESSVYIKGTVRKDERQVGGFEILVSDLKIYQIAEDYPIGKKEHGVDFLMDNRHLWLRSRRQWAIMRIRNRVIFAIHNFFHENGFVHTDTPIFTGNAAEGTTTLFETEFYDKPAYLAQTGQLYGEALAMALGKIYTFGPTFRAEKSKTRRHLSEFWMIEPEMAFHDQEMTMDLMEEFTRYVVKDALENCKFELEILERNTTFLDNVKHTFKRLTYDDAVKILKGEMDVKGKISVELLKKELADKQNSMNEISSEINELEAEIKKGGIKKGKLNFMQEKVRKLKLDIKNIEEDLRNIPQWINSAKNFEYGNDFGGSDETVLTRLFETPVMVYNWPKAIKAFYMKEVEGRPDLVKGIDMLAPEGYGEIIGGSERETDLNKMLDNIKEHKLDPSLFDWYLDLRKFGSVPHAGFGLGLERFITWICGIRHIREAIAFPRMMGRLFP